MPIYLVLIGLPGAGKGTQATVLSKERGLTHISSGDLFRDNIKRQTDLGKQVEAILKSGALVPDDVTIAMVRARLKQPDCAAGAVLDGFPRTPAQADALDAMLAEWGGRINLVPYVKVRDEVLVERLSGRWTCKTCGTVYHEKHNPPAVAGKCDKDGGELFQRPDDKAETVTTRIQEYVRNTAPLIEYYRNKGLLVEIDGEQVIEKVTADLLAAVGRVTG
jgi:adenylate kinase